MGYGGNCRVPPGVSVSAARTVLSRVPAESVLPDSGRRWSQASVASEASMRAEEPKLMRPCVPGNPTAAVPARVSPRAPGPHRARGPCGPPRPAWLTARLRGPPSRLRLKFSESTPPAAPRLHFLLCWEKSRGAHRSEAPASLHASPGARTAALRDTQSCALLG
jgi:hypothetical protein